MNFQLLAQKSEYQKCDKYVKHDEYIMIIRDVRCFYHLGHFHHIFQTLIFGLKDEFLKNRKVAFDSRRAKGVSTVSF